MKTNHNLDLSDNDFQKRFADGSLDSSLFNHEAHLRLAWIQIKKYGIDQAIENMTRELSKFVTLQGAREKYHETMTVAAIRVVYHFVLKSNSDTFPGFMAEFPVLQFNFRSLLNSHYSIDLFSSSVAKEKYIEPDLQLFD